MNIEHLRYFQKLAQIGHFSKAAKELCIAQPALSNSIKKLEQKLGFQLFEQSNDFGRSVKLTVYGREFLHHIEIALCEIDKAARVAGPEAFGDAPTISLSSIASVRREFLPKFITAYLNQCDHIVDFDLHDERSTFKCTKEILDGTIDAALCGKLPDTDDIEFLPILPQYAVVAVNKSHPLATRKSISLKEIARYPIISYRDSVFTYYSFKSLAQSYGIQVHQAFEDETGGAIRVLTDMRFVALLLDTIEGELRNQVSIIPIEELNSPFHMVGLIYKKSSIKSKDFEAFIEYSKQTSADKYGIQPLEDFYIDQLNKISSND